MLHSPDDFYFSLQWMVGVKQQVLVTQPFFVEVTSVSNCESYVVFSHKRVHEIADLIWVYDADLLLLLVKSDDEEAPLPWPPLNFECGGLCVQLTLD